MEQNLIKVGGHALCIEVAATEDEIVRGLSGRDNLPWDSGMLFVEERPKRYSYWMKGMRFPLDLIWVDEGGSVVDITENATPHLGEADPPLITPCQKVLYVIEVNAGWVAARGVQIGDKVELRFRQ